MEKYLIILPEKSGKDKNYVLAPKSPYLITSDKSNVQVIKDSFSINNWKYTYNSKIPCLYFISKEKISIHNDIKNFSQGKITLEIMQMELKTLIPSVEIQKAEYTGELINHNLRYLCILLQILVLLSVVYWLGTVEILDSPFEIIIAFLIFFIYFNRKS